MSANGVGIVEKLMNSKDTKLQNYVVIMHRSQDTVTSFSHIVLK
jgi:hypothetical protein